MKESPFFSIITCTKNSERFLKKNLNSVENQTHRIYEHIFVDGYSTDNTIGMINKYKNGKDNVIVIKQTPNGISSAMNFGIKKAKGKYILFLHSDDSMFSEKILYRTFNLIKEKKEPDMVYGMVNSIDQNENELGIAPKFSLFKTPGVELLKIINYIPHQAVFIKRDVFNNYGYFDTKLKYCMDYEYWLRITPYINWQFIPLIISNYRIHPSSVSGNPDSADNIKKEINRIKINYLNKIELFISNLATRMV